MKKLFLTYYIYKHKQTHMHIRLNIQAVAILTEDALSHNALIAELIILLHQGLCVFSTETFSTSVYRNMTPPWFSSGSRLQHYYQSSALIVLATILPQSQSSKLTQQPCLGMYVYGTTAVLKIILL